MTRAGRGAPVADYETATRAPEPRAARRGALLRRPTAGGYSGRHGLDGPDVQLIVKRKLHKSAALSAAMLSAAVGGCGDGSSREGVGNETRIAVMCAEISQDENDAALERETREWCVAAFRDTGDAEVRGVLKAIRTPDASATPKP